MDLAALVGLLVGALLIGAVARFALPGPDPLPIWGTILLGLAGSALGGLVAGLVGAVPENPSTPEASGAYFLAAVLGATLVLFLYRRFWQGRPITGPDAKHPPAGRDRG